MAKNIIIVVIALAAAAGGGLAAFRVPYFFFGEKNNGELMSVAVVRGDVASFVEISDAKVAAEEDFELGFPFGGIVERVLTKDGDHVATGTPLVKLDSIEAELEAAALEAILSQRQSNLQKLLAGPTKEDLAITETKTRNAGITRNDAREILADKIRDAHTKADNAVRSRADKLFLSPLWPIPQLSFLTRDNESETELKRQRPMLEQTLNQLLMLVERAPLSADSLVDSAVARSELQIVAKYLTLAAAALDGHILTSAVSQATIDGWKTDLYTARANVSIAIADIIAAEEKLKAADAAVVLATSELEFKRAGARAEDINIVRAEIREVGNNLLVAQDRIYKSTLTAPSEGVIKKNWLKVKELYVASRVAVTFSTPIQKVQVDIPELDIGLVVTGNVVFVAFDALPEDSYRGYVGAIEPKEVIKNIDETFYRAFVYLDQQDPRIRSGMSARVKIRVAAKQNVILIPSAALVEQGSKTLVRMRQGDEMLEREITVGLVDSDFAEIITGLQEGESVLVSSEDI
ncbi:MAG: biotin/lipoyl-binding protein [bacterium]|nr:biotin/lipoyl-binding protein [bacterium]